MRQNGRLVLASQSPRRRDLLASAGLAFDIEPSDVAEVGYGGNPMMVPARITLQKVKAVKARLGAEFDGWILGADTIVTLDGEIFGKPNDRTHARAMLARLSGREHSVVTGVRIESGLGEVWEKTVETRVRFAPLDPADIEAYVATGEPDDKAGAYAIQGGAAWMVEAIQGSYTNVVGLPLRETVAGLVELGALARG